MNRIRPIRALLTCALIAVPWASAAALHAEPLPPELNLIPRDAAMFVSSHVGDLWNNASMKPLRDFLGKEGDTLRRFEKDYGFKPDDIDRVTLLVPGFDPDRGPGEPWMIVTFAKPYDLEKLLDAWHGMTPAEARQFKEKPRFDGPPKDFRQRAFPTESVPKSPLKFEPKFPFEKEPRIEKKELAPQPKPFDKNKEPIFFARDEDDPPIVKKNRRPRDLKASYYVLRDGGFLVPINDRTCVVCKEPAYREASAIPELLAALLRRSDDGPLASALEAAAGKHTVVAGFNLPLIKAAIPTRGSASLLPFDSILSSRSATLTFDLGDEMRIALTIDSSDAGTAKRAHDVIKAIYVLGIEMLPGVKKLADEEGGAPVSLLLSVVEPLLKSAEFEQRDKTVTMTMKAKADVAWAKALTNAIEKVRDASERARASNNLKQVGIAVHNYESAYGLLVFSHAPPNNQPKMSWRVALLPYIEQASLFNEYRPQEPWDSDHNKKLIPKMPKIYAPLGNANIPEGHTHLRVFSSPHTFGTARSLATIPDGTSNTIMVVESSETVPWTKPDDFPFDPKKPKAKLGFTKGKMTVVLGDGSVRTIDLTKISDTTLRNAILTDDGYPLGSDW